MALMQIFAKVQSVRVNLEILGMTALIFQEVKFQLNRAILMALETKEFQEEKESEQVLAMNL